MSDATSPDRPGAANDQPTASTSSPRHAAPSHTPSISFSPGSVRSPNTARRIDDELNGFPLSPPDLQRQESVPLATVHHKLPFVSAHKPAPPHAPARGDEEGITSATIHASGHQHRRQDSASSGLNRPHRSSSSIELEPPSRSHSIKNVFGGRRQATTDSGFSHRRSRSERGDHKQKRSRSRSRARDPLQQAADSLDDETGEEHEQVVERRSGDGHHAKEIAKKLKPTRLVDLHRLRPDIAGKSILPTIAFPGQGSGRDSEFVQDDPIWARYPYKALYLVYFGLSIGFVFLPWFALVSLFPSMRPRQSWTWKRATLVRLYRHGTRLTFRTHTNLSRDLSKDVPHSETLRCKFIWIDPMPEDDIRGELGKAMTIQKIAATRTCGFWYGEPLAGDLCEAVKRGANSSTGVGRRAGVDEKVVYHLHGGAYWIGTAHEKDVTAAVNTEVLRYLSQLYDSDESLASQRNRCTRSLSLDYRLCVPNRPRIGSYPAALLDAIAGYLYLVRWCGFKPNNIIVAGDSAGGNLALALCRYLRDEKIEGMPGSLLLLSPWADVSRSHAGPLSEPNPLSSVSRNKDADIISDSTAFRNTAVSAFIGELPARDTYRNPYLSSCSLQLDPLQGGDGPDWGFEQFPLKTYIVTGSAEISNDQHLTLAHRMASGTKRRRPIYTGDKVSEKEDPYELAARLNYPRPSDHEISLWPSATATPAPVSTQGADKSAGHIEKGDAPVSSIKGSEAGMTPSTGSAEDSLILAQVMSNPSENGPPDNMIAEETAGRGEKTSTKVKTADFASPGDMGQGDGKDEDQGGATASAPPLAPPTIENTIQKNVKDETPDRPTGQERQRKIFAKSTNGKASVIAGSTSRPGSSQRATRPRLAPLSSSAAFLRASSRPDGVPQVTAMTTASAASTPGVGSRPAFLSSTPKPVNGAATAAAEGDIVEEDGQEDVADTDTEEGEDYFELGGEERQVWLDEVRDGVHDLLLFPWHEPERGQCWRRIAKWIDED